MKISLVLDRYEEQSLEDISSVIVYHQPQRALQLDLGQLLSASPIEDIIVHTLIYNGNHKQQVRSKPRLVSNNVYIVPRQLEVYQLLGYVQ